MKDQEDEIAQFRREKDDFFKTDPDSPLPSIERSSFKGLTYFPQNKNYRISAKLERFDSPQPMTMSTSTGSPQSYLKYGTMKFELNRTHLQLTVFKPADDPFSRSLFIPFSDETSGTETYGSGRYLDLEEEGGDDYDLDFNFAYNPYCAYNDQYTCPLPPRENRIAIRILAGEKKYK